MENQLLYQIIELKNEIIRIFLILKMKFHQIFSWKHFCFFIYFHKKVQLLQYLVIKDNSSHRFSCVRKHTLSVKIHLIYSQESWCLSTILFIWNLTTKLDSCVRNNFGLPGPTFQKRHREIAQPLSRSIFKSNHKCTTSRETLKSNDTIID